MPEEPRVECVPFLVVEKPYCVWGVDLRKQNLRFLDSVDPAYFEYVAAIHRPSLEGEHRQHAALALRATYSQALETFFAFLGAALQAPHFVLGWILKYQPGDLDALVTRIDRGEPLPNRIGNADLTWEGLSGVINGIPSGATEEQQEVRLRFAEAWQRLAHELRDRNRRDEFNSIKHGLRLNPGGFHMAVGPAKAWGEPAAPEEMESLGGSEFGSTYSKAVPMRADKKNFQPEARHLNWAPRDLANRIEMLACSLKNLISALIVGQDPEKKARQLHGPSDFSAFEDLWAGDLEIGVTFLRGMGPSVDERAFRLLGVDEIRRSYEPLGHAADGLNSNPRKGNED